MANDLRELKNIIFDNQVEEDASSCFASFLETYRNFDSVIDSKDALVTAIHSLSFKESKLPNLAIYNQSFIYEKYYEDVFKDESFEIPTDDLHPNYSARNESNKCLFVVGKAEEAHKYLISALRLYENKSVYVFGSDSTSEYETAFDQLEDAACISAAEAYEEEIDVGFLFFNFVNVVEFSGCENRIDIVLLKDNYPDVQRRFINLVLNYKYRENKVPYMHIYVEDENLFNEFKDNKMCVLYNEDFFAKLLKSEIHNNLRNLAGLKGNIGITYFGNGTNNVALAKALEFEDGYSQQSYPLDEEESNYLVKGLIFVDTGDFEKDLICIKSIRRENKDVPIYWLHNDLDKMIIFKGFSEDEKLFPINPAILGLYDFEIQPHTHAYDENNEDEEKLEELLADYYAYGYMAYKISRTEPPFDRSILEKAKALAKNHDFANLKELYKVVDENKVCHFEDFNTKAKGISESIFARLEILYYLGKYASNEEFEMEWLKLAVIRYAKIISFAGNYEYVCSSFEALLDRLIPYFVKYNKKNETLIYIYNLLVSLCKVYKQNVFTETACKMQLISLLFDIENGNVNKDLLFERIVYPCFEISSFHTEDETEFSESYVELYIELVKYLNNVKSSGNLRDFAQNLVNLLNNKSSTFTEIQDALDELNSIKVEDR